MFFVEIDRVGEISLDFTFHRVEFDSDASFDTGKKRA